MTVPSHITYPGPVPRWEPDARGRLIQAAVELFGEQGYDRTTVAQIAERAGLTKTTFFRHFPDKREVLFIGQARLMELAATAVAAAPVDADPLTAVAAGVEAMISAHTEDQRTYAPQLQVVVMANAELRERGVFKRASIAGAIAGALRERGVDQLIASVAAELGTQAYYLAFDRWVEPANRQSLAELGRAALAELRAAAAAVARPPGGTGSGDATPATVRRRRSKAG